MISDLDTFSAHRAETNSLSELNGATVAIDAKLLLGRYFDRRGRWYDPLYPALGGIPIGLGESLKQDLDVLKQEGVIPLVIFDGIDAGKKFRPFARSNEAATKIGKAWDFYLQSQRPNTQVQESGVLSAFREPDCVRPDVAYGLLQTLLVEEGVQFQVAPYSASGQIAYLYKNGNDYIDAVAGSADLLLFDVDKVILDLNLERKEFNWVRRQQWMEDLSVPSADVFVDACILSGTETLEPLPILRNKNALMQEAVMLMVNGGKSGAMLCKDMQDSPAMTHLDYFDRFCRNRLAVRHHVILTTDGKIETLDADNVPNDLHQIIGQRLSEEVYYYLSIGAIGSRILSHLTSSEIYETVPLDGGNFEEYRKLVREKLAPIRQTALALLSSSMHRGYQFKRFTYRFWFDEESELNYKSEDVGSPSQLCQTWKVPQDTIQGATMPSTTNDDKPSISFAIQSLKDTTFTAKTIASRGSKMLQSAQEVSLNVLWRFLHVREYLDAKHQLAPWGKVLSAIIGHFGAQTSSEMEQASILATEMLRADLLSSKRLFPQYAVQTVNGDDSHNVRCLLLSRIACLGNLQNKSSGYTGRMSRSVVAYSSMVAALQKTLRDLAESCFANLLLNNDATREGTDLTSVGLSLPFLLPLNCALGLAANNYLEEIAVAMKRVKSPEDLEAEKRRIKDNTDLKWLPSALDLESDLNKVWTMFDAIHTGVKVAAEQGLVPKALAEEWSKTQEWLAERK